MFLYNTYAAKVINIYMPKKTYDKGIQWVFLCMEVFNIYILFKLRRLRGSIETFK